MTSNGSLSPSKDWKKQLALIASDVQLGNNLCADCHCSNPVWSAYNHGIFICIDCSGIHRQMGVDISKVKSIEFDVWKDTDIQYVRERGNIHMNAILEYKKPKYFITPSDSPIDNIRRFYIQQKYAKKIFINNSQKWPAFEMPEKLLVGNFLQENSKKKVYLHLFASNLYYFRYNHDSYHCESLSILNIQANILKSPLNEELILNIYSLANGGKNGKNMKKIGSMKKQNSVCPIYSMDILENGQKLHSSLIKSIFRFRSQKNGAQEMDELIQWVHAIRRANLFYNGNTDNSQQLSSFNTECSDMKEDSNSNIFNHSTSISVVSQFSNTSSYNNKPSITMSAVISASAKLPAVDRVSLMDLENACILGFAHKKGGDARNWNKRWWILLNAHLYYFKDDFRKSKKSGGVGVPKGNICLYEADIVWDKDGYRSGKLYSLLVATPVRTYFIQPQQQNRQAFYKAVDASCNHFWNRTLITF